LEYTSTKNKQKEIKTQDAKNFIELKELYSHSRTPIFCIVLYEIS